MSEESELLATVRKIHGLLELLAEEKIAERDGKLRGALREIVGSSSSRQKSIFLMDGSHIQAEISKGSSVAKGNLSAMISKLKAANLLTDDVKKPKLAISIPQNFFEKHAK